MERRPTGPEDDVKRALLIINRKGRRGQRSLDQGLRRLEDADIEVEAHYVRDPRRIPQILSNNAAEADMVILGGGDGTLCWSLESVLETGLPLGIIPLGNANDLARTLGVPIDSEGACGVIAAGHTRPIDLGLVNGKHFFNVASMGASVRIARRLSDDRKRKFGIIGYVLAAWEALTRAKSFSAEIVCDGKAETFNAIQIAVGNGRYYGGGMTIVDDAAIDDSRLDLYALPPVRLWKLMLLFPLLRWGKQRHSADVQLRQGRKIEVRPERRLRINTDGELTARTPATFEVVPKALAVFLPANRNE